MDVEPDSVRLYPASTEAEIRIRDGNEGTGHFSFRLSTDLDAISLDPEEGVVDGDGVPVRVSVDPADLPAGGSRAHVFVETDRFRDTVQVVFATGPSLDGQVRTLVEIWSLGIPVLVPRGVGGAFVRVGEYETTADDSGFFAITGFEGGEQAVSVIAPGYIPLDTTIVNGSWILYLTIDPDLVDYVPLHVGNRYTYSFWDVRESYYYYSSLEQGTETWEIEACSTTVTDTVYTVHVHRSGTRRTMEHPDSAYVIDEVKTGTIRQEGNRVHYSNLVFPQHDQAHRYYPANSPEILEVLHSLLRLRRGVGLDGWHYDSTIHRERRWNDLGLVDWEIVE